MYGAYSVKVFMSSHTTRQKKKMKVCTHMLKKNSQTEPAHTIHEPTHTIHKPTSTIHVPAHEIKIHIPAPTNKIHIPHAQMKIHVPAHAQLKFHAPPHTGRTSGTPNHSNSSSNTKIVLLFIGGRQEGHLDNLVDHLCHLSQLATGCVTCHACHGCVTDFRPILGNPVEVTHVTSPGHVYIFPR